MLNKAKLVIEVLRSEEFKLAVDKASDILHDIAKREKEDLKALKMAYKQQKQLYVQTYTQERKVAIKGLFKQAIGIYEQRKLSNMLKDNNTVTVFD